jgi:gamma-glutamylcyclotransferase (GGCT)/AIG2-like uncharacterized protein YtfP
MTMTVLDTISDVTGGHPPQTCDDGSVHSYFAYGSNMSAQQMAERCPGSTPGDLATLPDFRFLINERGVATAVPSADDVVHGVLWTTTDEHIAALDGFEGLAKGNYTRETIEVDTPNGTVEALVYLACHHEPGPPRVGYLETVLGGARAFGLPASYIAELAGWRS